MNCQEAQSHIEDVVDRHLSGSAKRRFDLHLARCAACRALFAAEQREHARWFRAFNDPVWGHEELPSGFADRLALAVAASPRRRRFLGWLPNWGRVAAALALMASLVAFGAWLEVIATHDSSVAPSADSTADSAEPAVTPCLATVDAAVGSCGETEPSFETFITPPEKGTTVKTTFAAAVLAIGASALPVAALQTTADNTCIISGSTDRSCATAAYAAAGDLDTRVVSTGFGLPLDPFEARVRTQGFGEPLPVFRSDACGFVIIFR